MENKNLSNSNNRSRNFISKSKIWNVNFKNEVFVRLTLNLPTTTIVAQPFNVIKWQLKFNPVA